MIITQSPLLARRRMRQGDAPLIRNPIMDDRGNFVTRDQIESLTYQIWDTTSNTDAPFLQDEGDLDPTVCWYNTAQPWEQDLIGYNFAHRFPAIAFATELTGDRQYKVEGRGVQAVTGDLFWFIWMLIDVEAACTPFPASE